MTGHAGIFYQNGVFIPVLGVQQREAVHHHRRPGIEDVILTPQELLLCKAELEMRGSPAPEQNDPWQPYGLAHGILPIETIAQHRKHLGIFVDTGEIFGLKNDWMVEYQLGPVDMRTGRVEKPVVLKAWNVRLGQRIVNGATHKLTYQGPYT